MTLPEVLVLLAALATLALGVWVGAMNSRRRLHRAFALMMVNNAVAIGAVAFTQEPWDAATYALAYSLALLPFTTLHFAVRFLQLHGQAAQRSSRLAGAVLLTGATALIIFLVMRDDLLRDDDSGVFSTLRLLPFVVQAGTALLVARLGARAADAVQREALQLLSLGLAATPAFFAMMTFLSNPAPRGIAILETGLAAAAALLCLFVAVQGLATPRNNAERRRARVMAGLVLLAFVTAATTVLVGRVADSASVFGILLYTFASLWRLAFAALVAYSILRFHLFSIDPRFQGLVRDSGFAALAAVAFFIVEQFLEQKVQGWLSGPAWLDAWFPYLAALAAMLALLPLRRRLGEWAARLVPARTAAGREHLQERRRDIFQAAWQAANVDGRVTPRERQALVRLAQELGLPTALANEGPAPVRAPASRRRAQKVR